jgi:hypothetical protein
MYPQGDFAVCSGHTQERSPMVQAKVAAAQVQRRKWKCPCKHSDVG